MLIELIAFPACPHVETARERLTTVLHEYRYGVKWLEWNSTRADTPDRLRGYASPTILFDGVDVVAGEWSSGAGCALAGAPTLEQIRSAFASALAREEQ